VPNVRWEPLAGRQRALSAVSVAVITATVRGLTRTWKGRTASRAAYKGCQTADLLPLEGGEDAGVHGFWKLSARKLDARRLQQSTDFEEVVHHGFRNGDKARGGELSRGAGVGSCGLEGSCEPLALRAAEGECPEGEPSVLVGMHGGGAEVVEGFYFGWGEGAIVDADVVDGAVEINGVARVAADIERLVPVFGSSALAAPAAAPFT
jgi:hypothetical protein